MTSPVEAQEKGEDEPYFKPILLRELEGVTEFDEPFMASKAFAFHRIDVEKIYVLGKENQELKTQLDKIFPKEPSFWDSGTGKIILTSIGFVTGVGVTIGIMFIVN